MCYILHLSEEVGKKESLNLILLSSIYTSVIRNENLNLCRLESNKKHTRHSSRKLKNVLFAKKLASQPKTVTVHASYSTALTSPHLADEVASKWLSLHLALRGSCKVLLQVKEQFCTLG